MLGRVFLNLTLCLVMGVAIGAVTSLVVSGEASRAIGGCAADGLFVAWLWRAGKHRGFC